ncbi:phosphoglucan phosphatase DSP4, amyloplastic-like [Tasmannia lanceolata]|uniref:phosphoglucan phosphatase DSP4, amyloplastic-like n=1 Tax=Tasmannia lanceolata TaxID=3420 RepID=UPI0040646D60
MFWLQGCQLREANGLLLLTGLAKNHVTLTWKGQNCSSVEISGLDIGWGQRIPLRFDEEQGLWNLERELPEGLYEYKYIVDGEWTCNKYELIRRPNKDGHVNNYVYVNSNVSSDLKKEVRNRLMDDDADLMNEERLKIRQRLEAYVDDQV